MGGLILQYTGKSLCARTLHGDAPVCWSLRTGCRSRPGNQRPPRNPPRSDSRRNTPPGWCAGRSGRCHLASPRDSQASLSRSSGACSSCNAVWRAREDISVRKDSLGLKNKQLFMTNVGLTLPVIFPSENSVRNLCGHKTNMHISRSTITLLQFKHPTIRSGFVAPGPIVPAFTAWSQTNKLLWHLAFIGVVDEIWSQLITGRSLTAGVDLQLSTCDLISLAGHSAQVGPGRLKSL